jgi:uncharacterized protein (DUF2141 family)
MAMGNKAGLLCIFLAGAGLAADEQAASVSGAVTNALTGEPILRAHVTMIGGASGRRQTFGALTNAAGKFSITGMPPGRYITKAERVGFTARLDSDGSQWTALRLGAGDKKDDLKLKLIPAGAITGRVLDADGEPMPSIAVEVERGGGATTDEKGQFRIGGLAPGKYRVKAAPENRLLPPEIRTDGTVEAHYIATWYPNSQEAKSSMRVEVPAGVEMNAIDIHLLRAPIVRISGTVTGLPAGTANVEIEMRQAGGVMWSMTAVKPDGTFQIWRLDPGKYSISARWDLNGRTLRSAPVDIDVAGSNVEDIDLRIIPPFNISGQLVFDDERAKPHGLKRLDLANVDDGPAPGAGKMEDDGSFLVQDVHPGRYRVSLSWKPAFVKSMRQGSAAIEGDILEVRYGGAAPLSVLVSSAAGEIFGTVSDASGPVANARVMLVQDEDVWFVDHAITGENGVYHFPDLEPGKYKLAAVDANDPAAANGHLDDYEDVMEIVEIQPGDKLSKDLKRHTPAR